MKLTTLIFILLIKTLSSQPDSCLQTKTYFPDGKIETEGCVKNGKKEGVWKEYSNYDGYYIHILWTYKNDFKDGPYKVFGKTGIIEASGQYKLGSITDTIKMYNDKGKLTNYEVWKPTGGPGSSSILISKKTLIKAKHPDYYTETVSGKTYIWMGGRRYETK